jgi:hypothetical protein
MEFLKFIYYGLRPARLPREVKLHIGFIFHTEEIQKASTFAKLKSFCQQYTSITGSRALCTVMSPENPRIREEMRREGVPDSEFANRLHDLRQWADIGYHGHFWKSGSRSYSDEGNQIKVFNFSPTDEATVLGQFQAELEWFTSNGFTINSYSAGWWFINPFLMTLLHKTKIALDFSFCSQPWINNFWAKDFLKAKQVAFGESFKMQDQDPVYVQTLMGCTVTDYPMDFVRVINKSLKSERVDVSGMITTHDYNILRYRDLTNAIKVVRHLAGQSTVAFCSEADFRRIVPQKIIV